MRYGFGVIPAGPCPSGKSMDPDGVCRYHVDVTGANWVNEPAFTPPPLVDAGYSPAPLVDAGPGPSSDWRPTGWMLPFAALAVYGVVKNNSVAIASGGAGIVALFVWNLSPKLRDWVATSGRRVVNGEVV